MTDDFELALEHHGVKGMRWGVRKRSSSSNSSRLSPEHKEILRKVGSGLKIGAKTGLKIGAIGALTTIGVPAFLSGASVAALSVASPELFSAGKDYARLVLDEKGVVKMSELDKVKAAVNVKKFEFETTVKDNSPVRRR